VRIETPRDRDGSFEPLLLPNMRAGSPRSTIASWLVCARPDVREIQGYLAESYGTEYPTDQQVRRGAESRPGSRPLETVYPVVFFDACE